ncbi:MAG: carbon monoxide dehydrogenase subunit G [Chloroflexota bacterium]|nr:carbon monoxide dehydrogenase subunit G [Chloroflexota bacterium]
MKIVGEYTFDAPREQVWAALNDPAVLARIMPGCEKLTQKSENEYEGALNIKVGPVQGIFQGLIKLTDINEPESYKMQVDGKGAPGFVKGVGGVVLEAQDDKTLMRYDGDAQVGGRIASVGQRLVDSSAKSIIKQSLEGLNTYIKAKSKALVAVQAAEEAAATAQSDEEAGTARKVAEAAAAAVELPQMTAPSQRQVAATIAKDLVQDLVPEQHRPLVYAAAMLIAAFTVLGWFMRFMRWLFSA